MKKGPKVCLLSSAFSSFTVYFVASAFVLLSLVGLLLLGHWWDLTFIYYFLGLLPIIGELKFCGKVLEDAASIYYDDQLISEQKCVDVVIDGMHVHCLYRMECLVLNYILRTTTLCMDTRTHENRLACLFPLLSLPSSLADRQEKPSSGEEPICLFSNASKPLPRNPPSIPCC